MLPEDPPGKGRKGHQRPTPMAGVVVAAVAVAWLAWSDRPWLAAGVGVAGAVGTWDDWRKTRGRGLGWRPKAAVLLVAAVLGTVDVAGEPALTWLCALWLALFFVVANASNFLDNTNGVAAGLAAVGLLLATGGEGPLSAPGWACLGFLVWNWPRASLFLGDGGALALGMCLGAAAIERGPCTASMAAPVAVHLIDFGQVVLARLYLGFAPWIGDRRHLPHIVQNMGLPQVLVAPFLCAAAWGSFVWLNQAA